MIENIDPVFFNAVGVGDIPEVSLGELQTGNMLGYTGGGNLKRVKTSDLLGFIKSGIKSEATQANAPTVYDAGTYPDGLFETYVVRTPITSPNSWGNFTVTQLELDANFVYFDVNNGVITKVLSFKQMPSGSATLNPTDAVEIPSSKATADYLKDNQSISVTALTLAELAPQINYKADSIALVVNDVNPLYNGYYKKIGAKGSGGWDFTDSVGFIKKNNLATYKETLAELQSDIYFEDGEIAIVTNEPNPIRNGVYVKSGGLGTGGWVLSNFHNPLHHKKVTPTTANDTESLAIGGGHSSIFQDEEGTGQGHTAFGFEAGLNIGNCWATTCVGWKAGRMLSNKSIVNSWTGLLGNTGNTLYGYNTASIADGMLDCSYFGTSAGQNSTTCMDNAGFGIWSLRLIEEGSENAGFGHLSLGYLIGKGSYDNVDSLVTDISSPLYSWGHRNVGIGDKAGALDNGGNPLNFVKKCVYVGCKTSGNNFAYNENVFGYMAEGLGSNTVAIGNNQVKTTHHFGVLASFCDRRVADLPTPSRFLLGARTHILDCTHRTFDLEAIGGGSNNMPVWCDGSVWRVG